MPSKGERRICHRICLVQQDGFSHQAARLGQVLTREATDMPMGSYGPVPGIELTLFLPLRLLDLGCDNASLDRGGNASGDLVLEGKDIGQFAIVAIRPQVVTSRRLDQLCRDAETIGGSADAAFEHVAHAELATHFAYVRSGPLVSKGGAARDHKK